MPTRVGIHVLPRCDEQDVDDLALGRSLEPVVRNSRDGDCGRLAHSTQRSLVAATKSGRRSCA